MASFKNLVFVSHPMVPGGIMAKYRFDNGKEISIVAGEGLYSTPPTPFSTPEEVLSFEVMFDGEVTGWQSREQIEEIFKNNQ